MKILHVTNRKGGVGKTTVALHAAWYFAERYRVLFIELDDQRNASSVIEEYNADLTTSQLLKGPVDMPRLDKPGIVSIPADDEVKTLATDANVAIPNLRKNVLAAESGFDVCIMDSAPSATALSIGPLLFATHAIAPIELSTFSLQGVSALLQSVIAVRDEYNPDLEFLGLLPNKFVANQPMQRNGLKDVLDKIGERFMFDGVLTNRQAYAAIGEEKRPVWTDTKTASREAGKEIRAIMDKIETRMFKRSAT